MMHFGSHLKDPTIVLPISIYMKIQLAEFYLTSRLPGLALA